MRRRLLLVAAADQRAIWRSFGGRLSGSASPESHRESPNRQGFLRWGRRCIRHPLVRSVVYRASDRNERSEVHVLWRKRPMERATQIAARGTGRRRIHAR